MIAIVKHLWAVRTPVVILAASLATAAAGVAYTARQLDHARATLENQRIALEQARRRYRKSGQERRLIVRYLPQYRRLEHQGFIGPERRIDWLDALRTVNRKRKMFGVSYRIGAQRPYPGGDGPDTGPLHPRQSPMRLTFGLLHGGDLIPFFSTLERMHVGLFVLRACTVARIENGTGAKAVSGAYRPHLQADCQLSWITLGRDRRHPARMPPAALTGSPP